MADQDDTPTVVSRVDPARERQRALAKARWADPVAGKKWKAALTSQPSRLKMAQAAKARWADPEFRARGIAQLKAISTDPEVQKKKGSASKARWADPVMRAKIIAGMKAAKRRKRSGTGEQRGAPEQERGNIF